MVDENHLAVLREGVDAWNAWRRQNPSIEPDLAGMHLARANLYGAHLGGANLFSANLSGADLGAANLCGADLERANLGGARLVMAHLVSAHLVRSHVAYANLSGADLTGADLAGARLTGADLAGAKLERATLVGTKLTDADLTGCRVYGISAWDVELTGVKQENLIITEAGQPEITVDNLEIAQFIYLLLHNEKIRHVIDTITSKVVLILGRFTPERKAVLDALREELRRRDYLPVLFDFEKPAGRNITETISLLARMARFVVADITDARSIPQELGVIVPDLPSVPVQPLLLAGAGEYAMFEHFRHYPWVLATYVYASSDELIVNLAERVIGPAEAKAGELRARLAAVR